VHRIDASARREDEDNSQGAMAGLSAGAQLRGALRLIQIKYHQEGLMLAGNAGNLPIQRPGGRALQALPEQRRIHEAQAKKLDDQDWRCRGNGQG
jgi:hypothetical protein